ncbi:MAG: Dihydrolipoyl dehydrogenase [Myxococcota bacterium]|nr:Dihydrolipoyl dehydrogenase [Myxococcota bacterium]
MSEHTFDVVVIGSGPGGYVAAARAGALGLKTAVIEKDNVLGGTCLNRGCIPTKAILHAADILTELHEASQYGITTNSVNVDIEKLMKRKQAVVAGLNGGVKTLMKKRNVTVFEGLGAFRDANTITVSKNGQVTDVLKFKNAIVAVGTVPRELPGFEFDGQRVISSDHALNITKVPARFLVLGSGAVGAEFASAYARFGSKTTVVEIMPRLMPLADADVSAELKADFERQGIECMINTKMESVTRTANGVAAKVRMQDGGERVLEADQLLVAVGRKTLVENIGLDKAGVKVERGMIVANEFMQTSAPHIYAIGDVVGKAALAHVASAEGQVAAEHIAAGKAETVPYHAIPWNVYTEPPIGWVGLTEQQARDKGYDVVTAKFGFSHSSKATILGKRRGFIKIVSEKKHGEVLGAHIIGPAATELIGELGYAITIESSVEDIARTVHAHPTLYEGIMEAAAMAAGHPIHG